MPRARDALFHVRPRVLGLIAALDKRLNSDGLLEKLPGWVFVEWSRANSLVQDVNYPSNMMYAETPDAAARLYELPDLAKRAAKMRETIRRQSLTADGWYCDNAVRRKDGSLRLSGERTEVCQYYAFFTGVATKERDAKLWDRLSRTSVPSGSRMRSGTAAKPLGSPLDADTRRCLEGDLVGEHDLRHVPEDGNPVARRPFGAGGARDEGALPADGGKDGDALGGWRLAGELLLAFCCFSNRSSISSWNVFWLSFGAMM